MNRAVVLGLIPLLCTLTGGCNSPSGPSPTRTVEPVVTPPPPPQPTPTPQATQTHTLIMTASPSCPELPDAAKERTYPAQVVETSNGDIVVGVVNSYDIMVGWANEPGFTGKRDGNTVRLDITDDISANYAMIERIPGVGDVGYAGTATGTIDDKGTIVATFNGEYRLADGSGRVLCHASDHRVEVTPK